MTTEAQPPVIQRAPTPPKTPDRSPKPWQAVQRVAQRITDRAKEVWKARLEHSTKPVPLEVIAHGPPENNPNAVEPQTLLSLIPQPPREDVQKTITTLQTVEPADHHSPEAQSSERTFTNNAGIAYLRRIAILSPENTTSETSPGILIQEESLLQAIHQAENETTYRELAMQARDLMTQREETTINVIQARLLAHAAFITSHPAQGRLNLDQENAILQAIDYIEQSRDTYISRSGRKEDYREVFSLAASRLRNTIAQIDEQVGSGQFNTRQAYDLLHAALGDTQNKSAINRILQDLSVQFSINNISHITNILGLPVSEGSALPRERQIAYRSTDEIITEFITTYNVSDDDARKIGIIIHRQDDNTIISIDPGNNPLVVLLLRRDTLLVEANDAWEQMHIFMEQADHPNLFYAAEYIESSLRNVLVLNETLLRELQRQPLPQSIAFALETMTEAYTTINTPQKGSSSLIRRLQLKIAERFGRLDQKQFDELLEEDFQNYLEKNKPTDQIFSPADELARIKQLPSTTTEERVTKRQALDSYIQRFTHQQLALAQCRVFIERSIEFNPNVLRSNLLLWVERFGTAYGFTNAQSEAARKLIDLYYWERQKVLNLRAQYPDDRELIKALGITISPNAKFKIEVGPISIDIVYLSADMHMVKYANGDHVTEGIEGEQSYGPGDDPVAFTIHRGDLGMGRKTLIHERYHLINRLFDTISYEGTDSTEMPDLLLFQQYKQEDDPEIKRELMETFFRLHQKNAFIRVKDEILAIKSDSRRQLDPEMFSRGESYNFVAYLFDNDAYQATYGEPIPNDPIWLAAREKIINVQYKKIIREATKAFNTLDHKGRYKSQEVIALLTDIPLEEWPSTTKRILKYKNK